jgi:hypothetical protein
MVREWPQAAPVPVWLALAPYSQAARPEGHDAPGKVVAQRFQFVL